MQGETDLPDDIHNGRDLDSERELLLALWELANHMKICFVSFDLEGPYDAITEFGLVFQRKTDSHRVCRHIVVKGNQHKMNPPKQCGFGISSAEVDKPEELSTILDKFFAYQ